MSRLEVGSGYAPTPGYVHLDANPALPLEPSAIASAALAGDGCDRTYPHVDIQGSAYPLPSWLGPHRFDAIRAVDVLEHISWRHSLDALRDWADHLEPGGELYVQVPDAGLIISGAFEPALLDVDAHNLARFDLARRALELWEAGVIPDGERMTVLNCLLMGGHADGEHVREADDWRWNAHYALFDRLSLEELVGAAGLDVVSCVTNRHPNLQLTAVKR